MKYDFDTVVDRSDKSSAKWNEVKNLRRDDKVIIPFSVADLDIKNAPQLVNGLSKYIKDDGVFGSDLRTVINHLIGNLRFDKKIF